MQNISEEICRAFREARREKGLTQSSLAQEVGCHQAALSMFEKGNPTKLSNEYVTKIAERLGLDLASLLAKKPEPPPRQPDLAVGYCPEPECPSNVAYSVGLRTFFRISLQKGAYCAHCGEVLEKRCPSCGAALNEGACCTQCGKPYVKQ